MPLSGFSSLTGYRGFRPMHIGISYGDPTAGLHGAVATLAALFHGRRSGEGQYIDLSQWESTMALLPEGLLAQTLEGRAYERDGNHDVLWTPHAVYRCEGEDRWVSIAVASDDEWRALASAVEPAWLGDSELAEAAGRKRREEEIDERLSAWCVTRSREQVTQVLQQAGVAAFPVLDARDLHDDPHLAARGFFVELPHPEVGVRRHLGIPYRLDASPIAVGRAAPCLGQDTDEVLTRVLGYDADRIAALRAADVLR